MVTNAEYKKVQDSLNGQYTAESLQSYKTAYNDYLNQGMSQKDAVNKAKGLLVERGTSSGPATRTTPVSSPYENQGAGNYVYNEKTGYYENQTDTSRNTTNQGLAPRPENVKTETPTKQGETVVNTVPEIKQQGQLKPLSQDYYNQTGDDVQNKIRANLNQYRQSNPGLFSTYEDFKKNFSYDARNDEQKQTLDAWYGEYQKGMEYGAMPTADLYTQYKDGSISTSDLEVLKTYNPEKYAELQAQINKGNIIAAYDDTAPSEKQDFQDLAYQYASELFKRFMSGDSPSEASKFFDEYKANMNSPEMIELQDKQTDLIEQGKNIQDQIATIQKDVEKEYEGTGATKSKINAIIADRTYELQQQLRTINNEYEKYATQYNNRATQYQNEFQLQLQEYQVNMQARNQQMQELGFAMDLMSFETPQQAQERQWEYRVKQQEYTNGNINSKDYTTRHKAALSSVENLLAQYPGIPTERSAEQMADDILKAIDNGSTLGAELTKINKFMQEKPEYKKLYNATFGTSQGFGQTITIGGQDYIEYDGKLYTSDEFNKKFGGKANYTVVSADKLQTYSDGRANTFGSFMANPKNNDKNYVGECGKFVNNYLQEIGAGRLFGNEDIATRESWINSDEGKVGTIAVFDYNHYSSDGINHGHVGIVVSAPDKNGDFWVKDANFDSDGKIQTRKVNIKDVSLKGFIDPSKDQNGNSLSSTNNNTSSQNVINGEISDAGITQLAKDMLNNEKEYSEIKAAYGEDILKQVENRMLELQNNGFERSTIITDPTKQSNMEEKLRKEYDKAVEDSNATINRVQKMDDAYAQVDDNLNAASQALVIAYNKILDEGSVVREGEYARTADGQSLIKRMTAKANQIAKGGAGISKSELKSLVDMAHTFSKNAENYQKQIAERTKVSIDKYGLTPEAILPTNMVNQLYGTTTGANSTGDWQDGLNKSSDVFKVSTNIGGFKAPANFYQS